MRYQPSHVKKFDLLRHKHMQKLIQKTSIRQIRLACGDLMTVGSFRKPLLFFGSGHAGRPCGNLGGVSSCVSGIPG
jgi:hypothetical protein